MDWLERGDCDDEACKTVSTGAALVTALLSCAVLATSAVAQTTRVEADELSALIAGNSLEGAYANNAGFQAYFDKAGRFVERTLGNPQAEDRGAWLVEKDGRLCHQFNTWYNRAPFCTAAVKHGGFLNEYTANNAAFRRWVAKAGDPFKLGDKLRDQR